jgi:GTP-binding protein YchF
VKVALVGFRGSGKTSVFNALTGQTADTGLGKKSANLGRIQVPDSRVDALSAIYQPKKTTYAEIAFIDVAGPEEHSKSGLDQTLVGQIREAEALVHVVRAFDNPALTKDPDPAGDIGSFEDELILTDLVQVEKRVARLKKEGKRTPEWEQLEKIQAHLESGQALRRLKMEQAELQVISGFAFLSLKPELVVLNQPEDQLGKPPPPDVLKSAEQRNLEIISMSALMEAEIMAMEPGDQKAFLDDLGLTAPARTRFIQACYRMLDLISFLTVGEDEVRAWTISRGTHARAAAGKIHSDLEHGFIRAEVMPSKDFLALGSEAKVKEAGKHRLEGKDYVVQDGDIMHIRHSG